MKKCSGIVIGSGDVLVKTIDLFKCYYPKSSYKKDFYTCHTEKDTKSFIQDAIWSSNNSYNTRILK